MDCSIKHILPAVTANHSSATSHSNLRLVENKIREELSEGNYVICKEKPLITSALAAAPKPEGDIRLIHDFSLPEQNSVNDFALKEDRVYQSLGDAIKLLTPDSDIAKVNLKTA